MTFRQMLLEYRAKHDLTQTKLGDILGVCTNMVFKYEHGLSKPTAVNRIRFERKMKEWEGNENV